MVVVKYNPTDSSIPDDAVLISAGQARSLKRGLIGEWTPAREVRALNHGEKILTLNAIVGGFFTNEHYRHWLRLGGKGFIVTVLPTTVLPGLLAFASHKFFFKDELILNGSFPCEWCSIAKMSIAQPFIGVIYPMFFTSFACLRLASGMRTYPVPKLLDDFPEVWRIWKKFTIPYWGKFSIMGLWLLAFGGVITYTEVRQMKRLEEKIQNMNEEADNAIAANEISKEELAGIKNSFRASAYQYKDMFTFRFN